MVYEPAKNKVAILFFLEEVSLPLNSSQFAGFFVENGIINYFYLQQHLSELVSSELLFSSILNEIIFYSLTPKGSETLGLFKRQIPGHLKEKITYYIIENRTQIEKESQIFAEYRKTAENEYEVDCKLYETTHLLVEIKINVPSAKQAGIICSNWKNAAVDCYKTLMEGLI